MDGCRSCGLAPSKLDWFGWANPIRSIMKRDTKQRRNEGKLMTQNRAELNRNLAQMLKGGVIMDVTTPEQACIAEEAGACAVMALERIPADIRAAGGVSRMSDPKTAEADACRIEHNISDESFSRLKETATQKQD